MNMKLTKSLNKFAKLVKLAKLARLKTRFYALLRKKDLHAKSFLPLAIFAFIASTIWILGPHIAWNDNVPLAAADKRAYLILGLALSWLLKYLLLDQSPPEPTQYADETLQKKLYDIQFRYRGAVDFLNKTRITRNSQSIRLDELPWYLLIGATGSGKTSLLANSGINYILQRRQQQNLQPSESNKHYDWWVTRDSSIIDVPGKYMSSEDASTPPAIWEFFLRMARFQRGKKGINGIIIALPLAELLIQGDHQRYLLLLHDLTQRVQELRKIFTKAIPCQIVLTKCDLLPGFAEFFADSSNDETAQTWNIDLSQIGQEESVVEACTTHFNQLIKKLNQQLLWRLHRERDPMLRPYIKDFPLQIELMKEFTLDFIKKFSTAQPALMIQGVYLTSAMQETRVAPAEMQMPEYMLENDNIEPISVRSRAVQIFKEQPPSSRAYFIKQFISNSLGSTDQIGKKPTAFWQRPSVYITSASIAAITAAALIHDFRLGMKQANSIANSVSDYQIIIRNIQGPDEQFANTLHLLNSLLQTENNATYKIDLANLLTFYTHKSKQKSVETYQQALQTILIPQMQNYLADYLNTPVNKNAEFVYAALQSYLMMGNPAQLQPELVLITMKEILPNALSNAASEQLLYHMNTALGAMSAQQLNTTLIEQTRTYFAAMPSYELSNIILKTMNANNKPIDVNLDANNTSPAAFVSTQPTNQIAAMYTAYAFPVIINQDSVSAARQALTGNWTLGDNLSPDKNLSEINTLIEQLRTAYVNNYIAAWEGMLANVRLATPADLAQTDTLIVNMLGTNSPLLQILQMLHDNTYFNPVAAASPKLQSLGLLLETRNQVQNQLYQIFTSLQYLHEYLQTVLTAQDERKAAFIVVSNRMLSRGTPDAITQLRIIASRSPDPVGSWLDSIANNTWHYLMQDASNYIDISWQNQVIQLYKTDIADRYPFSANANQEVAIQQFVNFFGYPGAVPNFYNVYLRQFVDASTPQWRWKTVDNMRLPFPDESLRQIQYAMRIHHTFFPNGDNKIFVEFSLQPYQLGSHIKSVKLNINDKQFVDDRNSGKNAHVIVWPYVNQPRKTTIQLTLANQQVISHDFEGEWGWFKLLNQSFENIVTRKEIMLNLSKNEQPAKYLLSTNGQYNPFMTLNLNHFHLPGQLSEIRA